MNYQNLSNKEKFRMHWLEVARTGEDKTLAFIRLFPEEHGSIADRYSCWACKEAFSRMPSRWTDDDYYCYTNCPINWGGGYCNDDEGAYSKWDKEHDPLVKKMWAMKIAFMWE